MDYINNTIGTVGTALNNTVSVVGRTVGLGSSSEEKSNTTPVGSPPPIQNIPVAKPVSKSTVQTVTAPVDTPVAIAKPVQKTFTPPPKKIMDDIKEKVKSIEIKVTIEGTADKNNTFKNATDMLNIIKDKDIVIKYGESINLKIRITYYFKTFFADVYTCKVPLREIWNYNDNYETKITIDQISQSDKLLSDENHKKLIRAIIEKIKNITLPKPLIFNMFNNSAKIDIYGIETKVKFVESMVGGKPSRKQRKYSKKSRKTRRNLKN